MYSPVSVEDNDPRRYGFEQALLARRQTLLFGELCQAFALRSGKLGSQSNDLIFQRLIGIDQFLRRVLEHSECAL